MLPKCSRVRSFSKSSSHCQITHGGFMSTLLVTHIACPRIINSCKLGRSSRKIQDDDRPSKLNQISLVTPLLRQEARLHIYASSCGLLCHIPPSKPQSVIRHRRTNEIGIYLDRILQYLRRLPDSPSSCFDLRHLLLRFVMTEL